jgi:hypothetical protein
MGPCARFARVRRLRFSCGPNRDLRGERGEEMVVQLDLLAFALDFFGAGGSSFEVG